MPFTCKPNEADARERLRAFWAGASLGRPALYIVAANRDAEPIPWRGAPAPSLETDLDPAWHAWYHDEALRCNLYLAEAMPGVGFRWGTLLVTVAAFAGGEYGYHSDSTWIKPIPRLWERPIPRFDPHSPLVGKVEACLRACAAVVGDRGYVNPPSMLDGLTTLSSFRTPEQLCYDVVKRPDDVLRWSAALTDIYTAAYEHFYSMLRGLGYGDTSTWLQPMAEGRFEAVQCDFSVMLSPPMYQWLVLPDLQRTCDAMDYALYHLDGTSQLRFLDLLRTVRGLHGIQWNPEPGAGSPVRWIDAFRRIREMGFCLLVGCSSVEEAVALTRALGPDGLMLSLPRFAGPAEAERAVQQIARVC